MIEKIKDEKNPFLFILNYEEKAYLKYTFIYDRIEIEDLKVKEEFRGQKIASKLMDYLLDISKEENVKNITLEVRKDNCAAINLYKKYGFKEVGKRENYYQGMDAILMIKEIGSD